MSVEISRITHYTGDGLPKPTEVWQARLDEADSVYFTHPANPGDSQQIPTTALVVEQTDQPADEYVLAYDERKNLDLNSVTVIPSVEISFESKERVAPETAAMLANAAFSGAKYKDMAVRGDDTNDSKLYEEVLGMNKRTIVKRVALPPKAEIKDIGTRYVGTAREAAGYAADVLRVADIYQARYLPDNKRI